MREDVLHGDVTQHGDELRLHIASINKCVEAMGANAGRLIDVLQFGMLPDSLARQIELAVRPFTKTVVDMKAECLAFAEYSGRLEEMFAARQRAANYEEFFDKPEVGKVIN